MTVFFRNALLLNLFFFIVIFEVEIKLTLLEIWIERGFKKGGKLKKLQKNISMKEFKKQSINPLI